MMVIGQQIEMLRSTEQIKIALVSDRINEGLESLIYDHIVDAIFYSPKGKNQLFSQF